MTIQCTIMIQIHSKSICHNAFGNQMRVWMWYFKEGSMTDGLPTCRYSLSGPISPLSPMGKAALGRACMGWWRVGEQTPDPAPSPPRDQFQHS